ncbi:MAG: hypothetical protein V1821_03655 [bacterium]
MRLKLIAASFLLVAAPLAALAMSSTNYIVSQDDLSAGSAFSTSANYQADDTLAEGTLTSDQGIASANYNGCVGFWCFGETPTMQVKITTSDTACAGDTPQVSPLLAPIGTLNPVEVSTAANHICVVATTNAHDGAVATMRDLHGGLALETNPAVILTSATATLEGGTQGYGVCVMNAADGFSARSPFDGACNPSTGHEVGGLTTEHQAILEATGPITNAFGDILVKASMSLSTPAGVYADSLTFVVTGYY